MNASNRIIVNTTAQYVRTIINMLLSIYSTRLVLNILGVEDYGIYSLVAGVVSMLSFLTNSLIGSTQRFLSVSQGKGNINQLKTVFSNSLILHIGLGIVIALVLEAFTPLLFSGFLNIPINRQFVAQILYQQVIWMVYCSFITAPFRALLVSRENIVYTSIIDIFDGVLKVAMVLLLPFVAYDKLLTYGWIMFAIQIVNLGAFSIYCYARYEECVYPKWSDFSWAYIKDLCSYTGWVVYSTAVIAFRNQGVAIVINRFYNTIANASYGIGMQIAGMMAFVGTSFTNAISPQLMSSYGAGNTERMWKLAEIQSKFSFLLLALLAVPTMFEMPVLLKIWLGNVPDYAVIFACMFITMQTVDQLTTGLGLANRAIGNIGKYTLITFTPKLFILPISYVILKIGWSILNVVVFMILIEYICMLIRLILFKNNDGINIRQYFVNVILRTIFPLIPSGIVCSLISYASDSLWRPFLTYGLSMPAFVLTAYFLAMNAEEKNMINKIITRIIKR